MVERDLFLRRCFERRISDFDSKYEALLSQCESVANGFAELLDRFLSSEDSDELLCDGDIWKLIHSKFEEVAENFGSLGSYELTDGLITPVYGDSNDSTSTSAAELLRISECAKQSYMVQTLLELEEVELNSELEYMSQMCKNSSGQFVLDRSDNGLIGLVAENKAQIKYLEAECSELACKLAVCSRLDAMKLRMERKIIKQESFIKHLDNIYGLKLQEYSSSRLLYEFLCFESHYFDDCVGLLISANKSLRQFIDFAKKLNNGMRYSRQLAEDNIFNELHGADIVNQTKQCLMDIFNNIRLSFDLSTDVKSDKQSNDYYKSVIGLLKHNLLQKRSTIREFNVKTQPTILQM